MPITYIHERKTSNLQDDEILMLETLSTYETSVSSYLATWHNNRGETSSETTLSSLHISNIFSGLWKI